LSDTNARKHYCSRCLTTFEADETQCPNLACRRKRPSRGWGIIFSEGDVFDRTYRIHKMLAVGGAGVTYLARELDAGGDETGPRIAIKVLLAARDQGPYVRRLATEAQIIQELDHPNIVQYLGFVHRAGHSPYLLTRFEAGGSLLDHMRRVGTLPVRQAALVGRQICWALEKAHERGIVHRDLKPENVLLTRAVPLGDDPVIRVADFGIAKVQGSLGSNLTRVGAFVGTPHYAAPEQFVGGSVTEAADVYAAGALLYFTMTARHVVKFADRLDPEDGFQLLCDNLPPKLVRPDDDPEEVRHMNAVLAVAMEVDPLKRCSVLELDRMLEQLAAGQEPVIPVRKRPSATDEDSFLSSGASALGLTGALDDLEAHRPTRTDDAMNATVQGEAETESPAASAPEPQTPSVTPTASPTPAPAPAEPKATAAAPAPPPKKRRWGLLFGLFFLVVLGGSGALLGGGVLLWLNPELVDEAGKVLGLRSGLDDGRLLDSRTAKGADRKDLEAIQRSLETRKDWLAQGCKIPDGTRLTLTLVIDGSGTVQASKARGAKKVGSCVAKRVRKARFTRAGDDLVRVVLEERW
jgi:serine/threonine-protein kinase